MKDILKSSKGYTFLEVLLVLFSITLLLTIAVPSFVSLSISLEGDSMIEELIANYYWARQHAISQSKWVEIRFDSSNHLYEIIDTSGILKKINYSDQIRITENLNRHRIRFNGFGRLSYRGGTITIENEQAVKKLTIQMQTGQIDLE